MPEEFESAQAGIEICKHDIVRIRFQPGESLSPLSAVWQGYSSERSSNRVRELLHHHRRPGSGAFHSPPRNDIDVSVLNNYDCNFKTRCVGCVRELAGQNSNTQRRH